MTSQSTLEVDYPRYEISTLSDFLNLIYCNVFIAILSIACMTGALWAKRGERDISREARDEGKRKIKRLFAVHCSCSSAHLRPQILTTRGDVKRTNQNYRTKIVTFLVQSVCEFAFWSRVTSRGSRVTSRGSKNPPQLFLNVVKSKFRVYSSFRCLFYFYVNT